MAETIEYRAFVSELADRAYYDIQRIAAKDKFSIDPVIILTIVSVILQIVKYILEWYYSDTAKAANSLTKMNILKKWILWRFVRKEARSKEEAKYIYDSLYNLVYNLSDDERKKLFTLAR